MKNKTITYAQYNKQINKHNNLIQEGFKPIIKKNLFKIGLGCVCLSVGFITLPLPTGSIFLIGFGFMLLGFSLRDLEDYKRKVKNKFNAVYYAVKKRGLA